MLKEFESFEKNFGVSGTLEGMKGGEPCALEVERLRTETVGDIVRERSDWDLEAKI